MPIELILLNSLCEGEIKKPHLLMRLVPNIGELSNQFLENLNLIYELKPLLTEKTLISEENQNSNFAQ